MQHNPRRAGLEIARFMWQRPITFSTGVCRAMNVAGLAGKSPESCPEQI